MDLLEYSSDEESTDEESKKSSNSTLELNLQLLFNPVDGDYPSLLYIEAPDKSILFSRLLGVLASCDSIRSLSLAPLFNDAKTSLQPVHRDVPLHLSLSRVFTLRKNQIAPFIKEITSALKDAKRLYASTEIQLETRPRLYLNEVKTRGYFGLPLKATSTSIIDTLVDSVDSTMIVFGKPTYYKPADHHVSFAVVEGNDDVLSTVAETNGIETAVHVFETSQSGVSRIEFQRDIGKEAVERHLLTSSSSLSSSSANRKRRKVDVDFKDTYESNKSHIQITSSPLLSSIELETLCQDTSLVISWKVFDVLLKIGNKTHNLPI
jgi:hypothetical protein